MHRAVNSVARRDLKKQGKFGVDAGAPVGGANLKIAPLPANPPAGARRAPDTPKNACAARTRRRAFRTEFATHPRHGTTPKYLSCALSGGHAPGPAILLIFGRAVRRLTALFQRRAAPARPASEFRIISVPSSGATTGTDGIKSARAAQSRATPERPPCAGWRNRNGRNPETNAF